MVQKQITFCGEEVELDCRQRNGVYARLNPTKKEVEDAVNPCYRAIARPRTEKKINEFE